MDAKDKKNKKKKKPIIIILDILIVLLLAVGAFILLKPFYIAWKQDQVIGELDELIKSTDYDIYKEGILVDPNANAVEGEALENFGEEEPIGTLYEENLQPGVGMERPTDAVYEMPKYVRLIPMGQLQIDAIRMRLPIIQGAGLVQLRYGAGWYEKSSGIGEPGRCTLLGHAMLYNQRFFSKLHEIKIGDSMRILRPEGVLNYEVSDVKLISAKDLGEYLVSSGSEHELMLVTCANPPSWSQRLLVFAKPVR